MGQTFALLCAVSTPSPRKRLSVQVESDESTTGPTWVRGCLGRYSVRLGTSIYEYEKRIVLRGGHRVKH